MNKIAMVKKVYQKDITCHFCESSRFMCKNHTNCTQTCAIMVMTNTDTVNALPKPPFMTMKNGITVNAIEMMKPITYCLAEPWSWCCAVLTWLFPLIELLPISKLQCRHKPKRCLRSARKYSTWSNDASSLDSNQIFWFEPWSLPTKSNLRSRASRECPPSWSKMTRTRSLQGLGRYESNAGIHTLPCQWRPHPIQRWHPTKIAICQCHAWLAPSVPYQKWSYWLTTPRFQQRQNPSFL